MNYILFALIILSIALSSEEDHHYTIGDQLYAWTNRIGPYHNPHETYDYFSLPFCKPTIPNSLATKKGGVSEILEGIELQNSGITFSFKEDIQRTILCTSHFTTEEAYQMQLAVSNHYWYQMEVDGLPIWAKVGDLNISDEKFHEMESRGGHHDVMPENSLIYTHRHFTFGFNNDRIVEVNMTASDPQLIEAEKPIMFTYSTSWVISTVPFEKRFNRYFEYNLAETRIHWFSIFNSFMIVVFLAGLVTLIMMRTLKLDYIRYSQNIAEIGSSSNDDSGWKRVHGDVFRPCEHFSLYCILMGNGAHILFSLLTALIVIILVTQYVGRIRCIQKSNVDDRVLSIAFCVYALGFVVNGYVSGSLYKQAFFPRTSPGWKGLFLLSAVLCPVIVLIGYAIISMISVRAGSYSTFPFRTFLSAVSLFLVICLPLQLAGTLLGRSYNGNPKYPCRTSALPSVIPKGQFYSNPNVIMLISGILPFGCIFIEVFFIFASIWSYKYYYVYGFLIAIILILLIVQVCVSIVGTYLLLNAENYHWRWTSFLSGASIGLYLFVYCVYFYVYKTQMTGFVQGVSFFIESVLLVLIVSLFCGFTASLASSIFVKRIFKNIKVD